MGSSTTPRPIYRSHDSAKFLDQKSAKMALTMAMLTCNLHLGLIVIVAHWKLYTKEASRGRGIRILGYRWPPIYRSERGHVT